jgi:dTDP-4-amino-4,6-dideoxygalactose transaminase
LQKAYSLLGYVNGDFPISEKVSSQIVSLPMFPQLTLKQQSRIAEETARFVQRVPSPV